MSTLSFLDHARAYWLTRLGMQTSITAASLRRLMFGCAPIAALLLGSLAVGCRHGDADATPGLLERAEVDPEDGRRLYVRGRAFVPGQTCKLSLHGTRFVPGDKARSFAHSVSCRALSDVHVVASLDGFAQHPALFEGRLVVHFPKAPPNAPRTHSLEAARLRLLGPERLSPSEQLAWTRRAREAQLALGILDVEPTPRGLKLTRLAPEGAAARAGCSVSDVITRLNGAPVERAIDLIGATPDTALRVELSREGRAEPLVVRILSDRARAPAELLAPFWVALVAVLAFLSPSPKLPKTRAPEQGAVASLGLATGLLALNAALGSGLDARVLWLVPAGLRALWLSQAHAQRRLSLSALLGGFTELGIATLGIATLGLLQGSLLTPLGNPDTAWPWQWPLWSAPLSFLALLALSNEASAPPATPLDARTRELLLAGKAASFATFALGAGSLPSTAESAGMVALAWVLLALKLPLAWALVAGVRWPLSPLQRGLLALVAPALALSIGRLFPPQALPIQVLGATLFGGTLGVVARALLRAKRSGAGSRDPTLMPFL